MECLHTKQLFLRDAPGHVELRTARDSGCKFRVKPESSQFGLEDRLATPVTPAMVARAQQDRAEPFLHWRFRGCIRLGFDLHVVMRRGIARSTTKSRSRLYVEEEVVESLRVQGVRWSVTNGVDCTRRNAVENGVARNRNFALPQGRRTCVASDAFTR